MNRTAELLARLDRCEERLGRHAAHAAALAGLTEPDERSGERWEAGQVFAHLAEFGAYWVDQAGLVRSRYAGEPVPFGRVRTDPRRVDAIERDRGRDPAALLAGCAGDMAAARRFIRGLDATGWSARGVHPTLGVMDMTTLLDEFIVTHYEQHCAQLDGLAAQGAP
ncbi:MAG: hypothetical protein NVSMB29_03160 [Candidatus Dormibacteria bacterium]